MHGPRWALAAHQVGEADFAVAGTVYQIGLPPRRIDLLTEISGVSFGEPEATKVWCESIFQAPR